MRRRLIAILLFLLLGAMVNVVVAWACARSQPTPGDPRTLEVCSPAEARLLWMTAVGESATTETMVAAVGVRGRALDRLIVAPHRDWSSESCPYVYRRAGWPLRSMFSFQRPSGWRTYKPYWQFRHNWQIPNADTVATIVGRVRQHANEGRHDNAETVCVEVLLEWDLRGVINAFRRQMKEQRQDGREPSYIEGLRAYSKLFNIYGLFVGPERESAATILVELADVYRRRGRLDDAELLLTMAQRVQDRGGSLTTHELNWQLATLHLEQGRHDQAESLVLELLLLDRTGYRPEIPFRPIWTGFTVNSLFYAAAWFMLAFGVRRARRALRRHRGRCLRCGFRLPGAMDGECPECEWDRHLPLWASSRMPVRCFYAAWTVSLLALAVPVSSMGMTTLIGWMGGTDPNTHSVRRHCGLPAPWITVTHRWNDRQEFDRWSVPELSVSRLVLNVASYAAILWPTICGPSVLRRHVRIKRGHCIKCGYDLRGDPVAGCPECGWGRKEVNA
ncbi:MAG: tetratricopeptide repeat protein [Phycisphaerales bacterium]|nr:MAG: tetratricopeptide repeat protein [Phycisphaerales bacterium]